ncbi:MAG: hypothetical protein ACOYBD_01815 [Bilifractor sp.]|jgi:hypothetical protein
MKKKRCVLMKKKRNVLIQRKIRSEEGASLSVALLFFLVCAIVGSVILAAATSSMGRMKNLSSTEQDKNAVYSTARLVVRRMSGKNLADDKILPKVLGLSAAGSSGGGSTSGGSTSGGVTGNGTSSGAAESGNTTTVFKSNDTEKNAQIVCNAADNTLTTTVQFSFYRTVNDDGTYVDSVTAGAGKTTAGSGTSQQDITSGSGTSQSGKTSGSSTEQPGTIDKDYLNGQLPGSPFANLDGNSNPSSKSGLNLTGYESVRAGEIIHSFWNNYVLKDDGKLGASNGRDPGFEEGNAYNWIGDAVPGNHTWMYGHTDAIDSYLNNNFLKKQSYVLSVETDKDNEEIKVCVDFYMDKSLNIEAQIYPYKADKKSGKQTSTFKNASARCLVKIPANGGELQYTQDTDSEEMGLSASGAVSGAKGGSGTEGGSGISPAVLAQGEDQSDGSVTYKVTVTRSVTLSGFGWGNAKVYTGSAIAAQNPTEGS